jgi:hypothetical protein
VNELKTNGEREESVCTSAGEHVDSCPKGHSLVKLSARPTSVQNAFLPWRPIARVCDKSCTQI